VRASCEEKTICLRARIQRSQREEVTYQTSTFLSNVLEIGFKIPNLQELRSLLETKNPNTVNNFRKRCACVLIIYWMRVAHYLQINKNILDIFKLQIIIILSKNVG
jgi:hypothetical protein